MWHSFKTILSFTFVLWLAPVLALAQGADCPEIVSKALEAADTACQATGRNQACYGNINLTAQPQPDVAEFSFETVGDIVNVNQIQTMRLSPMNEDNGDWGVAILKLQANLPDTLPGQNVTFLLFGDVEITNAVSPTTSSDLRPMQAFYLRTGAGDARCDEAPDSGMLVQTPEGAGEVSFTVNGVDVQMGSTVFFQAAEDEGMTISTLEGMAFLTAGDETQVVVPGTWARVPIRGRFLPFRSPGGGSFNMRLMVADGAPEPPKAYEKKLNMMEALPLGLLERPIEMAQPLSEAEVKAIQDHVAAGGALCGEGPMPDCPEGLELPVRSSSNEAECVEPPGPNDPPLPATETRPLCAPPPPPQAGDANIAVPTSVGIGRPNFRPQATPTPGG